MPKTSHVKGFKNRYTGKVASFLAAKKHELKDPSLSYKRLYERGYFSYSEPYTYNRSLGRYTTV